MNIDVCNTDCPFGEEFFKNCRLNKIHPSDQRTHPTHRFYNMTPTTACPFKHLKLIQEEMTKKLSDLQAQVNSLKEQVKNLTESREG